MKTTKLNRREKTILKEFAALLKEHQIGIEARDVIIYDKHGHSLAFDRIATQSDYGSDYELWAHRSAKVQISDNREFRTHKNKVIEE